MSNMVKLVEIDNYTANPIKKEMRITSKSFTVGKLGENEIRKSIIKLNKVIDKYKEK